MNSTLLFYLTQPYEPPYIDENRPKSGSTTSEHYGTYDITNVQPWPFSTEWIKQRFGVPLNQERRLPESLSKTLSPQKGNLLKLVNDEKGVVRHLCRGHFPDLNRALEMVAKDSYHQVADTECYSSPADRNGLTHDLQTRTLVGEIKPSWVFHSSFDESHRHQALSQLLSYMHHFNLRYGYLLTNREMIAVKRGSETEYGAVFCSEPVPWDGILLALWGLHMLASADPDMAGLERPVPADLVRRDTDGQYMD